MSTDGTSRHREQRNFKPRWGVVLAALSATANVLRLLRESLIHH